MGTNTYLIIIALIIFFPLVLSFDRKVAFFKRWPPLFISILIVGSAYVIWDVYATLTGHWSFNPDYVSKIKIFHLPPGEILFFVVVPYSCIFIYECLRAYFKEKEVPIPRFIFFVLAAVSMAVAFIMLPREYSFINFLFLAILFVLMGGPGYSIMRQRSSWLYLLISYLPFTISNGFLTAIPVVIYGQEHFSGIRIGTIPLEDFFYSFSLLGFQVLVYVWMKNLLQKVSRKKEQAG